MYELRKRHKNSRMAQSYRQCTWQKSKRLLLPWFPAVIVPRLYFTRSQTNAILGDTIPRCTIYIVLGTSRLHYRSLGLPLLYGYHGCTPRGVSILRIPLVVSCILVVLPHAWIQGTMFIFKNQPNSISIILSSQIAKYLLEICKA